MTTAPVAMRPINNYDTMETMVNSIVMNAILLIAGILLFLLLWGRRRFRFVMRSRLHIDDEGDERRAPPSPLGLWFRNIMVLKGDDLIALVGLDAYFYLRFLMVNVIYFVTLTAVMCPVLIPLHLSGDRTHQNRSNFHFADLAISNIPNASPLLWVHTATAYFQAILLIGLLGVECRHYARARARHHLRESLTIQVGDLDADLRRPSAFVAFADDLVDDDDDDVVVHADVILSASKGLRSTWAQRQRHVTLHQSTADVDVALDAARQLCGPSHLGYVTLNSVGAVTRALDAGRRRWPQLSMCRAPLPDDLIWEDVSLGRNVRQVRRLGVGVVVVGMMIGWMWPISRITSLTSLESIDKRLPMVMKVIEAKPMMKSLLQGVLPAYAFLLLLLVTPRLLEGLSRCEGLPTYSARQASVFRSFAFILFFDFFLFSIVSRGFISTLEAAAVDPTYISKAISHSLPEQSTSVAIYLLSFTCSTLPFADLNQLSSALLCWRRHSLPIFPYGEYYAYQVLHALMGFAYATIAPLTLPFVALYFMAAAVVARVQFAYVYGRREGSGTLFPVVIAQAVRGAMIAVAILASVLVSKGAIVQAIVLAPVMLALALADLQFARLCRQVMIVTPPDLSSATVDQRPNLYLPPWQLPTSLAKV